MALDVLVLSLCIVNLTIPKWLVQVGPDGGTPDGDDTLGMKCAPTALHKDHAGKVLLVLPLLKIFVDSGQSSYIRKNSQNLLFFCRQVEFYSAGETEEFSIHPCGASQYILSVFKRQSGM